LIDIPNSLVGAIGLVNGACARNKKKWSIDYYPSDWHYPTEHGAYYIARVGSRGVIKKDLIDDLFAAIIDVAERPGDEQHLVGFE
jgi:hypothetical protein